ncbi:MAG: C2 family cysteine protease [Planctomycetota bacterium]
MSSRSNKRKQDRRLKFESLVARQLMAANAFGDFNADGYDDLVTADARQDIGGHRDAGVVRVTYGSRHGLAQGKGQTLTQDTFKQAEDYDRFGTSLAVGDFNGDGYDDLAVGSPDEDLGKLRDAGMVSIFYGSKDGLQTKGIRHLHQNSSGIRGTAEKGDHFGASLAAGDFDDDGYDDLAVGVPGDSVSGQSSAGLVNVIFGSRNGLKNRDALYSQNTSGVRGVSERNDQFGYSLAAGDFDGDGHDDLVIGVPREDVGTVKDAGVVQVLYGDRDGLTTRGDEYYHQNTKGIKGTAETGDRFGHDVTVGDFDGDSRYDLAIGVPYEDIGRIRDAGLVSVIYGSRSGLGTRDAVFYQGHHGISGTAEAHDRFGVRVAAGDSNGDGRDDLAIGTPYEDHGGRVDAGALTVIYGSRTGLSKKDVILSQAIDAIVGAAETNDYFARDVVFGDFNGDGRDDLAAVVSGENFGAHRSPTATNVIYGRRSSLAHAPNQLVVHARQTKNGFSLGGDDETTPADKPTEVTGSFLAETDHVDIPQEVSGSFLVDFDPRAIAKRGDGDTEAYSYNDIHQKRSSSCIFSSSLAAVARTGFNFASHIRYVRSEGEGYRYQVKLYDHQSLKSEWVSVHYDGTRTSEDMGHADQGEFWTVLYLRAYAKKYGFDLSELDEAKNRLYRSTRTAMQTITGNRSDWDEFSNDTSAQQRKLANALDSGKAVMAPTIQHPSKRDIPKKGGVGKTGLVYNHGYTVLSVENAGRRNATVTLRNPWGKDNTLGISQYDDGFGFGDRFEGQHVNRVNSDGIIRITWKDFQRFFQGFSTGSV